ncbi:MAG: DUF962 domain-containing protein [Pseudomonadales bacterium]|nr:DUF962 domain-containing protein [Pseudomonadales bacterium]
MKSLTQHLTQYAAYHRDKRNIATHFIGIPMIVFAVMILLSRPGFDLAGALISPALLVAFGSIYFYLKLDTRFGVVMGLLFTIGLWSAAPIAQASTSTWLGWGIGLFFIGWVIQFIGHYYEGRKPAFVDDLVGLIVGPLFVVAELGFMLGMRNEVRREIEQEVGPTILRDMNAKTPS